MIECKICGKPFRRITPTHLKQHDLTSKQYRQMFGPDSICSEENKKLLGRTEEYFVSKYGRGEGLKRWNAYRSKQAETNTFEYKQKTYGWTKELFDEYNKSRAVTLENLQARYGKDEGQVRFEEYCMKQAYAGTALDYFVEKYGEEEGTKRYERVCFEKGNAFRGKSLTDEHKLNCRLGTLRYLERMNGQLAPRYNPKACKAIDQFGSEHGYTFQHAENGGEVRLDIGYWLDGYDPEANVAVEYFEPFHDSPKHATRDTTRLCEIIEFLGCEMWIIKENNEGNEIYRFEG